MVDSRAGRSGESTAAPRPSEPALRLGKFPKAPSPEDANAGDAPTIISKHPNPALDAGAVSDLAGRRLAHFDLIAPIGVGGMAAVIRARDTQLDRIVALKILPPEMARDAENVRRFRQEARAAARLDHENVARVFFCGEDQGLHFIAFEFVEGENLRKILEKRRRLPVAEAVRYVLQVATGLEHAASRGVVHRDVKPSNIIITPEGRAKLVDMGLARNSGLHPDDGLTQSGVTLGTFDYISPEQALDPREADSRSDIYSLGCTFYHMLTGQPPVPDGTAAKKLHHHQHVSPVDPRQLNPEVPEEVAGVLSRMMAKNPRDRYDRPIQLVRHLMQVAGAIGAADDLPETTFVDVHLPGEPNRRPALTASLAVLGLAALLFFLSLTPGEPKKTLDPPPAPVDPPKTALVDLPKTSVVSDNSRIVTNEAELRQALAKGDATLHVKGEIALSAPLKLDRSVTFFGVGEPTFVDRGPLSGPGGGLRVSDGAKVQFVGIRFRSGVRTGPDAAFVQVTAAEASFEACAFDALAEPSSRSGEDRTAPAILASDGAQVKLHESYFAGGQVGLALAKGAKATATDVAFAGLDAVVQVREGRPSVAFEHCTLMLARGPAFRVDGDAGVDLRLEHSIVAVAPDLGDEARTRDKGASLVLVRQQGSDSRTLAYRGRANGFHRLEKLWVMDQRVVAYDSLKAFRKELTTPSEDVGSMVLAPNGERLFAHEGTADHPGQRFLLNPANRELHALVRGLPAAHATPGARKIQSLPLTLGRAPAEVAAPKFTPRENERVVDPDLVAPFPTNHYDTLPKALAEVKPGDVVYLKSTPTQAEYSLVNYEIQADLTLRGFPGVEPPVLRLGKTSYSEAQFFRLLKGRLHLENLHFVLEPTEEGVTGQSVIDLVGPGSATLRQCIVTLRARERGAKGATPLAVFTVHSEDDAKVMMQDAKTATHPQVALEDCFVRGDGDLVHLRGSRPLRLTVDRSLVCVTGSLLDQTQGASKEPPAGSDGAYQVHFAQSAFYAGEAFFHLPLGKAAGRHAVPVRGASHECLYVALDAKPFATFDLPEMTEKSAAQAFEWKGQKDAFLHFAPDDYFVNDPGEGLRSLHLDQERWKQLFYADAECRFYSPTMAKIPSRSASQVAPDDLKPRPDVDAELTLYFDRFANLPAFRRLELAN